MMMNFILMMMMMISGCGAALRPRVPTMPFVPLMRTLFAQCITHFLFAMNNFGQSKILKLITCPVRTPLPPYSKNTSERYNLI